MTSRPSSSSLNQSALSPHYNPHFFRKFVIRILFNSLAVQSLLVCASSQSLCRVKVFTTTCTSIEEHSSFQMC